MAFNRRYAERLLKLIESILVEGRQAGEFERKPPLMKPYAIYMVMCPSSILFNCSLISKRPQRRRFFSRR